MKACEKAAPCAEGEARITRGFRLQAEHVIHMVVPKASRSPDDYRRVHRAYRAVLRLCHQHGIARLNIPPIPMKEAGLPPLEAASIALETVREWMAARQVPRQVNFCCFSAEELAHYERALEALQAEELEATQD